MMPASAALADGFPLVAEERDTGKESQSKMFRHDGSWWAVLDGPQGMAVYGEAAGEWRVDANLGGTGKADVEVENGRLRVLIFGSDPRLIELDYNAGARHWEVLPGYPVPVPKVHASECLVFEADAAGRLWFTAEGDGNIQVYYTPGTDHTVWSTTPIVLATGVREDDISSIVAFGGDKIGAFWSDQNRDEFGFRFHRDADPPDQWSAEEVVYAGSGHADDHVNLVADLGGQVYALTKDDFNLLSLHHRGADGSWTTAVDVAAGKANHGIIQMDDTNTYLYALYTDTRRSPPGIVYRRASLADLVFGPPAAFITSGAHGIDNVTGMKQHLPAGRLIAIATAEDSTAWWNVLSPEDPTELVAEIEAAGEAVDLRWNPPVTGHPDSYHVYRLDPGHSIDDGAAFRRVDSELVLGPSFTDAAPPDGVLYYRVTAVFGGLESQPSNTVRVDNTFIGVEHLRLGIAPNPVQQQAQISFRLGTPDHVGVAVYGVRGNLVAALVDAMLPAGEQSVVWLGRDRFGKRVPAGAYLLVVRAGAHHESRKITLLQ
jgi:hypothetical protein